MKGILPLFINFFMTLLARTRIIAGSELRDGLGLGELHCRFCTTTTESPRRPETAYQKQERYDSQNSHKYLLLLITDMDRLSRYLIA